MKAREQMEEESWTLYDKLAAYGQGDFYPYHMPGHKRNPHAGAMSDFFPIDITEIDGFDNLHHAEGLLKRAQERAAKLYGAEETFFLINGSTCGILAAISAVTKRQDTVLIARNCHKSVYHALFLRELHVHYLYPGQIAEYDIQDAIHPADVEIALEQYPECGAVVITSPTYEGILSDIREISRIVHEKDRILIVDEAHGAHLGLAEGIPDNAVRQGADIVIHSLHKTLPSLTQTALLHVNGSRINRRKLRRYLGIYQSSSPSYLLMAGMDACVSYVQDNASFCFKRLKQYYQDFLRRMEGCRYIHIGSPESVRGEKYHFTAWDICKLVISVKSANGRWMSGQQLYDVLREEFHLQMEMVADSYVLAIMTIADEEEGWQRLADALLQIDDRIEEDAGKDGAGVTQIGSGGVESMDDGIPDALYDVPPTVKLTIAEALSYEAKEVLLSEAAGEVVGDFISLYPPGIPLLVPGEVIDAGMIGRIRGYQESGLQVQGISEAGTVLIC